MNPFNVFEFRYDGGAVQVRGTSEQLGDQFWKCKVIPDDKAYHEEGFTIEDAYPFNAATAALDLYKKKHNLKPSTRWTL